MGKSESGEIEMFEVQSLLPLSASKLRSFMIEVFSGDGVVERERRERN